MGSTKTQWILELVDKLSAPMSKATEKANKAFKVFDKINEKLQAFQPINVMAVAESFNALSNSLDFTNEIGGLETKMGSLVDDNQLEAATKKAFMISQVYGENQQKIFEAASANTNAFGGDAVKNMELFQTALKKGGNLNEEFFDTMKEYPVQMKSAGLSLENFLAIQTQAAQMGVYQDKGIDAIKEATLSLREMDKVQQDALAGVGLSYQKISAQVEKGDVMGAIRRISEKLGDEAISEVKKQKIVADIFKGAGEDAGRPWLESLASIKLNLSEVKDKTSEWQKTQMRLNGWIAEMKFGIFEATKEWAPFIQTGSDALVGFTQLLPAMQMGIKGFRLIGGASKDALKLIRVTGIASIKSGLQMIWSGSIGAMTYVGGLIQATLAQWGLNAALDANPIGLFVIGIAAAVGAIYLMIENWDWLKDKIIAFGEFLFKYSPFGFLINAVEFIFPGFKDAFITMLSEIWDAIVKWALDFWNTITELFGKVQDLLGFGDDVEKNITIKTDTENTDDIRANTEGAGFDYLNPLAKKDKEKDKSILDTGKNKASTLVNKNTETDADLSVSGSGSGKGGNRSISMKLDIKNIFNVTGGELSDNIEDIADKIIGRINNKLKDAVLAIE